MQILQNVAYGLLLIMLGGVILSSLIRVYALYKHEKKWTKIFKEADYSIKEADRPKGIIFIQFKYDGLETRCIYGRQLENGIPDCLIELEEAVAMWRVKKLHENSIKN